MSDPTVTPSDDPQIGSAVSGLFSSSAPSATPEPDTDADPAIASVVSGLFAKPSSADSGPSSPGGPTMPPNQHVTPTRFQQAGTPPTPHTPEPSWGQVGQQAVQNLIPSAIGVGKSMVGAIAHPLQTVGAIGQLGAGLFSQAQDKLGIQQDAQSAARTQALAKALESHYANTYGSVSGFKKAVSTDPASILMDASTFLGGAGAAADAANFTKMAALLSKTASVIDPVSNAVRLAALPIRAVSNPITRGVMGATTGVPRRFLAIAAQAGAETDPAMRQAFLTHFNGQGSSLDTLQTAQRALSQVKQDVSNNHLAGKGALANAPVDFTNTYNALDEADKQLGYGATQGSLGQKNTISTIRNWVDDVAQNKNSLLDADGLKQQVWEHDGLDDSKHIGPIYHAIKADISNVDPAYETLMSAYQEGRNNINDIANAFGMKGKNPAASAALARSLRSIKTPGGEDLLSQLAEKEPTLPYMMAGAALSPWNAGGTRDIVDGLMALPWAFALHNPAMAVGQFAATSPRMAGLINYGAGAVGRAGEQVATSPIGRGVYYAGRTQQEQANPTANAAAPPVPSTPGAIVNQIAKQESGGQKNPYGTLGPVTPKGDRAYGKYGIMGANIPAWTKEILGRSMTPEEFLNDPDAQDKVAQAKIGQLSGQFSDPKDIFSVWHSGVPYTRAVAEGRHDVNETTQQYADQGASAIAPPSTAANGGRIERASGGEVGHEHLVQRLMTLAERAKKVSNKATEPLLNVPDSAIAKALDIAQQAI